MEKANINGVVVFKHVCKFCTKSFPCGRSLGGHMRSHISSSSGRDKPIIPTKNKKENGNISAGGFSYELRENPERTRRAAPPNDGHHALLSCRECGQVFQSSKALFGHMKSHSEKERALLNTNHCSSSNNNNNNCNYPLVDDSWASASCQKLEALSDIQSDNDESTVAPPPANLLRRSIRTRPRYMGTATTSSSPSLANNASSSVSEIDQYEQEEVALCLIMLSRDVGRWRGSSTTLNTTAAESSEHNSLFLEAENRTVGKGKNCAFSNQEVDNTKLKNQNVEAFKYEGQDSEHFYLEGRRKMEPSASGLLKNRPKSKNLEASDHGYDRGDKRPKPRVGEEIQAAEVQLRNEFKNISRTYRGDFGTGKRSQGNRKVSEICDESDKMEDVIGKSAPDGKRSRFECATCNKVFHSYQALGGHRAGHKKIKGCSFLKPEISETSRQTELSPCSRSDTKLEDPLETATWPKKDQKHECPICFKVFLSGQALGGHKRSHLIAGSQASASNHPSIMIQKPAQEVREFLDLNLPAPVEEEASSAHVGLNPWWHEPLVGLT